MGDNDTSSKLSYFLVGAGVGAIIALLFAPKAGKELREDISGATKRSIDYANDRARVVSQKASTMYTNSREKANELYGLSRERTSNLVEAGRNVISDQKQRVAAAIEAGKKAYQDKKAQAAAEAEEAALVESTEQS
ncbi:MAG: YtxH domain-containing protein [Acidobacteria bacterium]|nr:YtxH domain-containing protein [Acidobacteriota bacterium]